ncbi:probable inactive patatin-like protein 9 [Elaeis guineensis]|uniref:Patatin n=1 Tax=Elaeis guineensis var. tenera TaxID=51953 RepID=A0A6I9SEJ1_ELAGV|nr:probable inactive patatin-like protein 9 [Elaeis guineensis]
MDVSKITLEIFSKLEKKWLMEWESTGNLWSSPISTADKKKASNKKTRILSIDGGGGLKGLAAGQALIHLEDCIKSVTSNPHASIPDYFDLVAGTGIGGVLAAMLTADDASGRPLFSARAAMEYLCSKRRHLFRPSGILIRRRRRRFSGRSFEGVLRDALCGPDGRALTLKNTCKPLLVPCYDLNSSAPFVFSRADAVESASFDFELWSVCRATAATPGLFSPCKLASVDGKTACVAVDGGLVMNNPAAAAVTHVLHNKRDFPAVAGVEDLLLLSLGGGPPPRQRAAAAGECSERAVMEIVLDGVSETVDQLLANAFCWNPTDYIRIQANGWETEREEDGEDAEGLRAGEWMLKERGVESLPFGGKRLLTESNGERIEVLVHRLVACGFASDDPLPPFKETAVRKLSDGR